MSIIALIEARKEVMAEIQASARLEDIVSNYVKHKVSRQYKEVVSRATLIDPTLEGVKVIWGEGGAQTKRIKEYIKKDVKYLHVPSKLLS